MAWITLEQPAAVVRLHTASSTNKTKIRWNTAAHQMMGKPILMDVFYDSETNQLAMASGETFSVHAIEDKNAYELVAPTVYAGAGIALQADTDFTPETFVYAEKEEPPPEMLNAIWIQLP